MLLSTRRLFIITICTPSTSMIDPILRILVDARATLGSTAWQACFLFPVRVTPTSPCHSNSTESYMCILCTLKLSSGISLIVLSEYLRVPQHETTGSQRLNKGLYLAKKCFGCRAAALPDLIPSSPSPPFEIAAAPPPLLFPSFIISLL
jgi:hypothetical protein